MKKSIKFMVAGIGLLIGTAAFAATGLYETVLRNKTKSALKVVDDDAAETDTLIAASQSGTIMRNADKCFIMVHVPKYSTLIWVTIEYTPTGFEYSQVFQDLKTNQTTPYPTTKETYTFSGAPRRLEMSTLPNGMIQIKGVEY